MRESPRETGPAKKKAIEILPSDHSIFVVDFPKVSDDLDLEAQLFAAFPSDGFLIGFVSIDAAAGRFGIKGRPESVVPLHHMDVEMPVLIDEAPGHPTLGKRPFLPGEVSIDER